MLLANTPTQAESLLHSLGQAASGIGLRVNEDKMEYICFNQKGDISTLNDSSLKLMNKFMHFRSSILSTENDINMQLVKAWTAINRLSIIWKSDISDKIKSNFFSNSSCINSTTWMLTKCIENKLDGNFTRMLRVILNKSRKQWMIDEWRERVREIHASSMTWW